MENNEIQKGMLVLIARNIDHTKSTLGHDSTMSRMAGSAKARKVTDIRKCNPERLNNNEEVTIFEVNGYVWMAKDLIAYEPDTPTDVQLTGEKMQFDPAEL